MFRQILKEQIRRHEGIQLKPYRCTAGKLTIGYGRNLDDNGISQKEADFLLNQDIDVAIDDARLLFPNFDELTTHRQAVLANMALNIGRRRLAQFVKLRHAVQQERYDKAANEMMDSLWASQVGNRATELSELMRAG